MAPFVSYEGAAFCQSNSTKHSLCPSALTWCARHGVRTQHAVALREQRSGRVSALHSFRTFAFHCLFVALSSHSDALCVTSPLLGAWLLAHIYRVCNCASRLRVKTYLGCPFLCRCSRACQSSTTAVSWCYARFPASHELSRTYALLVLLASLAVCTDVSGATPSILHSCVQHFETSVRLPLRTALSCSVTVIALNPAASGARHVHDHWVASSPNARPSSHSVAAAVILSGVSGSGRSLPREGRAPAFAGASAVYLSQSSRCDRRCYIALHSFRRCDGAAGVRCGSLRSHSVKSQPLSRTKIQQPLRQTTLPPSCVLVSFRHLSSACGDEGGLTSLCLPLLRSSVSLANSSSTASSVTSARASSSPGQARGDCRPCFPYLYPRAYRTSGTQDSRTFPGNPRVQPRFLVTCTSLAASRAQTLLEEIKKLTIVEVGELVSLIEQSFGVPAARVAAADVAEGSKAKVADGEREEQPAKPEKTAFSVEIKAVPLEKRINVIKTLRTVRPDLGLKDAKGVIDALPNTVLSDISKEKAEEARKILADAGAQVEVK